MTVAIGPVKYLSPVIVTAPARGIRATDSGGAFTANISTGTYYILGDSDDDEDLLTAIASALTAGGSETWSVTLDAEKKVVISATGASGATWSIDWDNSLTTFDGEILGVADLSAAFGAAGGESVTCDYQHQYGWYGEHYHARDSGRIDEAPVSSQTRTKSGAQYTYTLDAERYRRELAHTCEEGFRALPDAAEPNRSFSAFLATCYTATPVRAYTDTSEYFTGVMGEDLLREFRPVQPQTGVDLWRWDVPLVAVSSSPTLVAPTPDAFYRLEESGTPFVDEINGYNFTASALITAETAGKYDLGVEFAGGVSYIRTSTLPTLAEFSFCMWVYVFSGGGTNIGHLFTQGYAAPRGISVYCHNSGGVYRIRFTRNMKEEVWSGAGSTLAPDQWNFIGVAHSDADPLMKIWINAGSNNWTNTGAHAAPLGFADSYTRIGNYSGAPHFVADHAKYFCNKILTDAEFDALAAAVD